MQNIEAFSQSHDFIKDDKYIIREEKCEISANGIAKNGYSIAPLKETFTRLGLTLLQKGGKA